MNTKNIALIGLFVLLSISLSGWTIAQSTIEKQNKIISIDSQIAELKDEIKLHQNGYSISIEASKECEESFKKDAEKEHIEAEKKREIIKRLEAEKEGLMKNR